MTWGDVGVGLDIVKKVVGECKLLSTPSKTAWSCPRWNTHYVMVVLQNMNLKLELLGALVKENVEITNKKISELESNIR